MDDRTIRRARVWKADDVPGQFELTEPMWIMSDGWITAVCWSWEDAMRKARRLLRNTF